MIGSGAVVWITGLPGAGKSTLAGAVVEALRAAGVACLWLDGDDLRRIMTPEPTYARAERDIFYASLGHLGRLAAEGGVVAVISATADRRAYRDAARAAVPRFVEVWLRCDDDARAQRHPERLYDKAARGELANLPGYDIPYEEPLAPELTIDTGAGDGDPALGQVVDTLRRRLGLPV